MRSRYTKTQCMTSRHPQGDRSYVVNHVLKMLRERGEATLSNLVTASKTQVTSWCISPISLLDAAMYHHYYEGGLIQCCACSVITTSRLSNQPTLTVGVVALGLPVVPEVPRGPCLDRIPVRIVSFVLPSSTVRGLASCCVRLLREIHRSTW
jgi:hypothetical protein